jgi:hypothetical protein
MSQALIDCTEAAQDFLRKSGYVFAQLDKIDLDKDKQQWILVFNVGVATPESKKVVVDDATGKVVWFE